MLGILGFISIFVFAYFAFKTARDYGRNAWLWCFGVFGVGFGLQIVLPIIVGMILAVVWLASGTPADQLQAKIEGPAQFLGLIFLVLSIAGMFMMLKIVSRVPDTDDATINVPPPPQFGNLE